MGVKEEDLTRLSAACLRHEPNNDAVSFPQSAGVTICFYLLRLLFLTLMLGIVLASPLQSCALFMSWPICAWALLGVLLLLATIILPDYLASLWNVHLEPAWWILHKSILSLSGLKESVIKAIQEDRFNTIHWSELLYLVCSLHLGIEMPQDLKPKVAKLSVRLGASMSALMTAALLLGTLQWYGLTFGLALICSLLTGVATYLAAQNAFTRITVKLAIEGFGERIATDSHQPAETYSSIFWRRMIKTLNACNALGILICIPSICWFTLIAKVGVLATNPLLASITMLFISYGAWQFAMTLYTVGVGTTLSLEKRLKSLVTPWGVILCTPATVLLLCAVIGIAGGHTLIAMVSLFISVMLYCTAFGLDNAATKPDAEISLRGDQIVVRHLSFAATSLCFACITAAGFAALDATGLMPWLALLHLPLIAQLIIVCLIGTGVFIANTAIYSVSIASIFGEDKYKDIHPGVRQCWSELGKTPNAQPSSRSWDMKFQDAMRYLRQREWATKWVIIIANATGAAALTMPLVQLAQGACLQWSLLFGITPLLPFFFPLLAFISAISITRYFWIPNMYTPEVSADESQRELSKRIREIWNYINRDNETDHKQQRLKEVISTLCQAQSDTIQGIISEALTVETLISSLKAYDPTIYHQDKIEWSHLKNAYRHRLAVFWRVFLEEYEKEIDIGWFKEEIDLNNSTPEDCLKILLHTVSPSSSIPKAYQIFSRTPRPTRQGIKELRLVAGLAPFAIMQAVILTPLFIITAPYWLYLRFRLLPTEKKPRHTRYRSQKMLNLAFDKQETAHSRSNTPNPLHRDNFKTPFR